MRICIPTTDNEKQLSHVCDHFGSAPYFTIYDFEADVYETVNNTGQDQGALQKLNDGGIKVLRANQSTVKDIVDGFAENKLEEIDPENACRNHSCH
ncbi:MAG: NifB/NifX family molybdenum-iron cluster-binding protein [Planctomycetes bacterium]|nr:NifB/NifX family molybdenum-iron cluster-binding protein [Planctomycetota bacterium]